MLVLPLNKIRAMKLPHKSYEQFVKKQTPKTTDFVSFVDWYHSNKNIGELDVLDEILKRTNQCYVEFADDNNVIGRYEDFSRSKPATYFKDFFLKKLQLCHNVLNLRGRYFGNPEQVLQYDLEKTAEIMDVFEMLIHEISTRYNVAVCGQHAGVDENKRKFIVEPIDFKNVEEFLDYISSGIAVIFWFYIKEDFSVKAAMYKWDPMKREVLVERMPE